MTGSILPPTGAITRVALVAALAAAAALILAALLRYPLDPVRHPVELLGCLAGIVVLLGLAAGIEVRHRMRGSLSPASLLGVRWGLLLGAAWVVEIGYNNLIAPPVAVRDPVDDLIWAAVALAMVIVSAVAATREGRIGAGMRAGFWSGLVSGTAACLTALALVVFGMRFLLADPANAAEFAQRGPTSGFSTMAPYLAYQTVAGALLHLVVLGMLMGTLLGCVGGVAGKIVASMRRN